MTSSEILIYQNQDGKIKIDVRLEEETVWLTQEQMATLFGKGRSTITEHIQNVFKEGELDEEVVYRNFRLTTQHGAIEGKTQEKDVKHYNLDVIISVGYRVKSPQGTQFRIWATQRLKEYIIKGFALNDERFKSGSSMNYFTELQERIREIRLSERFFYQKIKDIYATSIDYDPKGGKTIEFFKVVQNKLLWAISQQTAGQIAHDFWLQIPSHFPFVKLGNHIVMPNHVHGIVIIDKPHDGGNGGCRDAINRVSTTHNRRHHHNRPGNHITKQNARRCNRKTQSHVA